MYAYKERRPASNTCVLDFVLIDAILLPHSSGHCVVNGIMKRTRPVTLRWDSGSILEDTMHFMMIYSPIEHLSIGKPIYYCQRWEVTRQVCTFTQVIYLSAFSKGYFY